MSFFQSLKLKLKRKEGTTQPGSYPGYPQGDTVALVPIVALTEEMLLTRDGAFVIMTEIPPLDIGFAGQDFGQWVQRYQMALEKLPPGTTFQMTVLLEPHDPFPDLKYFLDQATKWQGMSHDLDLGERKQNQAASLTHASQQMAASLAAWFDETQPITWRTILTLSNRPGLQGTKHLLFSRNGHGPEDLTGLLSKAPSALETLKQRLSVLMSAFTTAGIPLKVLAPEELCQVLWRALHPAATQASTLSAQETAMEEDDVYRETRDERQDRIGRERKRG